MQRYDNSSVFFPYRSGQAMRKFGALSLTAGLLFGVQGFVSPALAARLPDFNPVYPIEHQTQLRQQTDAQTPYAMNYTDEVAQSLGVVAGKAEFFDTGRSDSAYVPSLKGGVDHGGAMLRLQWHPGE
jgi:hypothetical protein